MQITIDVSDMLLDIEGIEREVLDILHGMAEAIGHRTVAYLRSLTGVMRPPAKPGGAFRYAHPGGWADITSNLANAYRFEVRPNGKGWTLAFINSMEYAAYLEAHDGYFVLSGVTDPGGPVEQAMRQVLAEVAPNWEIRGG